jgi:hypothetical protein
MVKPATASPESQEILYLVIHPAIGTARTNQ